MKILIVNTGIIPVKLYGGTERVVWYLGKELVKLGHEVTYLVRKSSTCDFGAVLHIDESKEIIDQIPSTVDIVHFNFIPDNLDRIQKPYLITVHGNLSSTKKLDSNIVFVSQNHASRYGSQSFVHNGLDWEDYLKPNLSAERNYFHFLGKAAWRVKNVKGAIEVINGVKGGRLKVLGGVRFNFNMGIRLTFSPKIKFYGMVGGAEKDHLLSKSKGLIFPVKWHEPFGLSIIESLYFGAPVFGTPYGSLPEIVKKEVGYLSNSKEELIVAVNNANQYDSKRCHEYAKAVFNSKKMALSYLGKYEKVLSNEKLNSVPPKLREVKQAKFLEWK